MFYDAIISIDKVITGNIYYQRNSQSTWDYFMEKGTLDCNNVKNLLNFLSDVFVRSS